MLCEDELKEDEEYTKDADEIDDNELSELLELKFSEEIELKEDEDQSRLNEDADDSDEVEDEKTLLLEDQSSMSLVANKQPIHLIS